MGRGLKLEGRSPEAKEEGLEGLRRPKACWHSAERTNPVGEEKHGETVTPEQVSGGVARCK